MALICGNNLFTRGMGLSVFFSTSWMDSDSLTLHTDASGTLGFGGILGNKWF